jgi:hypothetical protein
MRRVPRFYGFVDHHGFHQDFKVGASRWPLNRKGIGWRNFLITLRYRNRFDVAVKLWF